MAVSTAAMLLTLVTQMARAGLLSLDDVDAMAASLEAEGEPDAALSIRGAWIEAQAPPASEWRADRARSRFRIVPSDGGNSTA